MPFIPTPQCVEAKLIMSQNGVPLVNVWNIDVGHAVTAGDLSGVFAVIDAWITSSYRTICSTSVGFDQIVVTDVSVANGAQSVYVPTTTTGSATGAQSAGNAAFVASLRTAKTGRSFRGRTYVPGIPQSQIVDAQHVVLGYAVGVNTVFVNLINAMTTASYKLSVLSKYVNKVLRIVGLLTEITTVITDTVIDSQRRRTAN